MTQEQIDYTMRNWDTLSTDQKAKAKMNILNALTTLDNLHELSPEIKEKLNAGGVAIAGGIIRWPI